MHIRHPYLGPAGSSSGWHGARGEQLGHTNYLALEFAQKANDFKTYQRTNHTKAHTLLEQQNSVTMTVRLKNVTP